MEIQRNKEDDVMKRKLFFDMDGVLADFINSPMIKNGKDRGYGEYPEMFEKGFFLNLPLIEGALVNVRRYAKEYDVYILSQPVQESSHSYTEKVTWIHRYFPELSDKIILTQDKGLVARAGHILVDDNKEKWEGPWTKHHGIFFHFKPNKKPSHNWKVLEMFLKVVG
jgi:5'-nucleotidase